MRILGKNLPYLVAGILAVALSAAAGTGFGLRTGAVDKAAREAVPLFPRAAYAKSFYDEAFDWARQHPADQVSAAALTVNHHLFAKHLIARTLLAAAGHQPKRVIVISPDHFSRGSTDVTVASADYDTVFGIAETDQALVKELQDAGAATVDNMAMFNEHGIHNLMPFIKAAYPQAKVLGVMIKSDSGDYGKAEELLSKIVGRDDLVIASLDFSHYLTGNVAQFHDRMAVSVLRTADRQGAELTDIDCRACLHVLFAVTEARHAQRFTLFDDTSSAALMGFDKAEETTSYVNGAFVSGRPADEAEVTALLLPMTGAKTDAKAFMADLDPEREERIFYGQDMVVGWPGTPDPQLVNTFGMRNADAEPKDEMLRGLWVRSGSDGKGGVSFSCGSETVTYGIGGEPGLHRSPDVLAFNRPERLDLDAVGSYPTLALGVVCSASGVDVYPFFLQKAGTRILLEQFMSSQFMNKRYFDLDDYHVRYPDPQ